MFGKEIEQQARIFLFTIATKAIKSICYISFVCNRKTTWIFCWNQNAQKIIFSLLKVKYSFSDVPYPCTLLKHQFIPSQVLFYTYSWLVGWLVGRDLGGTWDLPRASAEKQPAHTVDMSFMYLLSTVFLFVALVKNRSVSYLYLQ